MKGYAVSTPLPFAGRQLPVEIYHPDKSGVATSSTINIARIWLSPIFVPVDITQIDFAPNCQVWAGLVNLGVYKLLDNGDMQLIVNLPGQIGRVGWLPSVTTPTILPAGVYWLALQSNNLAATFRRYIGGDINSGWAFTYLAGAFGLTDIPAAGLTISQYCFQFACSVTPAY